MSLLSYLQRQYGPLKAYAWISIALAVVAVVGVVIGLVAGLARFATNPAMTPSTPTTVTLTVVSDGSVESAQVSTLWQASQTYTATDTSPADELSALQASSIQTWGWTIQKLYKHSEGNVLVKYADASGVQRFALLNTNQGVYTVNDVGDSIDPTLYSGPWTYWYNGIDVPVTVQVKWS